MRIVGQKTTVKIDPALKRSFCSSCNTTVIPSSSASVRVKKSSSHGHLVVYTCLHCKSSKGIPAPPTLNLALATGTGTGAEKLEGSTESSVSDDCSFFEFQTATMGRRHQVYLIARVTPYGKPLGETRYRCIAALHCRGCLPLRAVTRFITLIKQKENAEIIREEINDIHGLYGIFKTPPELPGVPCPFTHFLMHSAWTLDLNDPKEFYKSRSGIRYGIHLKFCVPRFSNLMLVNDDGITIIDVTDPESPAYCFVSIHCEDTNIPIMTPLSASQYLRGYPKVEMDEIMLEKSVFDTLRPFESVPMNTIDMLTEAWPGEYTLEELDSTGLSIEPKESSAASIHLLPSLVDMIFVPALNYALQTGETDCLDPLMWLPGYLPKIKETLRAHNPLSAIDLALLSKSIVFEVTQTKSIDLSHFSLTGEQLIELLSAQEGVEVLNISHMQHITIGILRRLIPLLPNLRRLVLLHTISDTDVLSILSESPELFYRIDSFIHLAFLRHLDQVVFPAVFSHIITKGAEVVLASLPYFTPDQLAQALTDLLRSEGILTSMTWRVEEIPLLAAYASTVREPGRSWSERIVPFLPKYTYKLNEREGWFLAWLMPNPQSASFRYAFGKINKGVAEECQRRIDELRESFKLPSHLDFEGQAASEPDAKLDDDNCEAKLSDELRAKENAIKSEYADREFHIFDVKSFFQELVKEGRPAPSPEALSKLLELFAVWEKTDTPLCVMTPADLKFFLKTTRKNARRIR